MIEMLPTALQQDTTVSANADRPKLRVLVLAEAANPEMISVPLVGWSHFAALREDTDAHLVTQIRNRDAISRTGYVEGKDFTAIDSEAVARLMWRFSSFLRGGKGRGWTTVMAFSALSYYYFEHLVWKQFGANIQCGQYDIVHRLTPLSPSIPSLIARRCAKARVPFVLGPLNGGVPWPRAFSTTRRKEGEWLSYVRSGYKLLPGYRSTRKHASAIIIGSKTTWDQMPHRFRDKCVYVPENAIDPSRFPSLRQKRVERPLRVIFVGRLVPLKGVDMLLEAVTPLVRSEALQLTIVGTGPQDQELREWVADYDLGGGVELTGWVAHDRLHTYLAHSDVFAFPSIREFGGGVVLEAMAVGLVPVVMNYGGPAELVTPETGFLVEMGSRSEIVARFSDTLRAICDNPSLLDQRSSAARQRVVDLFTWEAKARQIKEVYNWVLHRSEKPDFGMPLDTRTCTTAHVATSRA